MDFPVWQPGSTSLGLFIGLIASFHVFISQFAVGGGFFLPIAERTALKKKSPILLDWVEHHSKFFLLVTMVLGSITGVGIWLTISAVAPRGASILVHQFYYLWATEWVFFFGEIVSLFLYAYSFKALKEGKLSPKAHMRLGYFYAGFAFFSLFIINGIITFMLTPGDWITTHSIWDGFFNPTFWPSLFFRFFLCLLLAGLFALVTATGIKSQKERLQAVRTCALWIIIPAFGMALSGFWYISALPELQAQALHSQSGLVSISTKVFMYVAPIFFFLALSLLLAMPRFAYKLLTVLLLITGLGVVGSFEWTREAARRPWLVYGYLYSNGVSVDQVEAFQKDGFLAHAPWARLRVAHALEKEALHEQAKLLREFNNDAKGAHSAHAAGAASAGAASANATSADIASADATSTDASKQTDSTAAITSQQSVFFRPTDYPLSVQYAYGKELFANLCSPCHGLGGPSLDILRHTQDQTVDSFQPLVENVGVFSPYMPLFMGTVDDAHILTKWLLHMTELHNEQKK